MPKVFIVQETDRNVESAREYGNIQVLLQYKDTKEPTENIYRFLYRRLREVQECDFILCIGDPVAIGLTVHIALTLTSGRINFLKWDKVQMKYLTEKISVSPNI